MTTTNHLPDQPPEAALSVSPSPSVEWIPLDGLAQQWATFASQSTRPRAFAAASLAFTALKQETEARHLELRARRDPRPTTAQAALLLAFEPLQQAASSWLAAIEQVDEYSRYDLSHDEEQSEQAVHLLLIESYDHLLQVACLSVRLVQELHQVLDAPVREALVPRDGQERKEAL